MTYTPGIATRFLLWLLAAFVPIIGIFASHGLAAAPVIILILFLAMAVERRPFPALAASPTLLPACLLLLVTCLLGGGADLEQLYDNARLPARTAGAMLAGFMTWMVVRDLDERTRRQVWIVTGVSMAAALFLFSLDVLDHGLVQKILLHLNLIGEINMTRTNRGAVVLAILVWPVMGWLWPRRKVLALGLLAWTAVITILSESGAAVMALVAGTAFLLAGHISFRWFCRLVLAGALAALALMPWIVQEAYALAHGTWLMSWRPGTIGARLEVWSFVAEKIMEKPLSGWGMDAGRLFTIPFMESFHGKSYKFVHPHNAPLQVWLDLGVAGVLAAGIFLVAVFRKIMPLDNRQGPRVLALVGATLTVMCVNVNLWSASWLGLLCLLPFYIGLGLDKKLPGSLA
ncbi:MAG: O-antigen ligase family protein [Pseudomonadota bacterium]|nr:O-antigen ligase family protein [Pseudomonadota bacterium]